MKMYKKFEGVDYSLRADYAPIPTNDFKSIINRNWDLSKGDCVELDYIKNYYGLIVGMPYVSVHTVSEIKNRNNIYVVLVPNEYIDMDFYDKRNYFENMPVILPMKVSTKHIVNIFENK